MDWARGRNRKEWGPQAVTARGQQRPLGRAQPLSQGQEMAPKRECHREQAAKGLPRTIPLRLSSSPFPAAWGWLWLKMSQGGQGV
jgi:hypothetical protein